MKLYVIDTSGLVNFKLYYPPSENKKYWDLLKKLNATNRLIIIDKVKNELKGYDYLSDFVKTSKITSSEEESVISCMKEMVKSVPSKHKVGVSRWNNDAADPFVIAISLDLMKKGNEVILIHGEIENRGKLKIPSVCSYVGVENHPIHYIINHEK